MFAIIHNLNFTEIILEVKSVRQSTDIIGITELFQDYDVAQCNQTVPRKQQCRWKDNNFLLIFIQSLAMFGLDKPLNIFFFYFLVLPLSKRVFHLQVHGLLVTAEADCP